MKTMAEVYAEYETYEEIVDYLESTPPSEHFDAIRAAAEEAGGRLIGRPDVDYAQRIINFIADQWTWDAIAEAHERLYLEDDSTRRHLLACRLLNRAQGEAGRRLGHGDDDESVWIVTDEQLHAYAGRTDEPNPWTVLLLVEHDVSASGHSAIHSNIIRNFLDSKRGKKLPHQDRETIRRANQAELRQAAQILDMIPAADLRTRPLGGTEYRVRHRRANWKGSTADRSDVFQTLAVAQRHVDKLNGKDRDDLSPVTHLHLEMRDVSEWRPFDNDASSG